MEESQRQFFRWPVAAPDLFGDLLLFRQPERRRGGVPRRYRLSGRQLGTPGVGLEVRVAALGYAYAELLACRKDRVGYAIRSRPCFAGTLPRNTTQSRAAAAAHRKAQARGRARDLANPTRAIGLRARYRSFPVPREA